MSKPYYLFTGISITLLFMVLFSGCSASGDKNEKPTSGNTEKEQPALIGMVKLDVNDESNIVDWKVDGTFGGPKLGSFDWELKENNSVSVWSGIAEKNNKIPDAVGVYYVDVNNNDMIDIGDIFRVKAPRDGDFTLHWTQRSTGNPGQYDSHY